MESDLCPLLDVLAGRRFAVLTGAGCSTESGIPDYRGPGTLARARRPMQYRQFADCGEARKIYWARSVVGWPAVAGAVPNPAHYALAELELRGAAVGVITQNVDGLHSAAGSERVIELHGQLASVLCLRCGTSFSRQWMQKRLLAANPGFTASATDIAPDGDADLSADRSQFSVPECERCEGTLKPNVVFFGESVPRQRVDSAFEMLGSAEALLVVGSSLAVYSGFRFVRRAAELGLPIAMVNIGDSRGDELAQARLQAKVGQVLPRLARALLAAG